MEKKKGGTETGEKSGMTGREMKGGVGFVEEEGEGGVI